MALPSFYGLLRNAYRQIHSIWKFMKIIDTHQHLIYPGQFSYSWCRDLPALAGKPFRLEEYRAATRGTGITETLFMEVSADEPQSKAEAEFFLQLATKPETGIIGALAACFPNPFCIRN